MKNKVDVEINHCGSIVQFHLRTQEARDWVEENVQTESWQFMGNALCVDPRYVEDLCCGMVNAGLNLQ